MDGNSQMNTILRIIDLVRSLQLRDIIIISTLIDVRDIILLSTAEKNGMNISYLSTSYPLIKRRYLKMIPLTKMMYNHIDPFYGHSQDNITASIEIVSGSRRSLLSVFVSEQYDEHGKLISRLIRDTDTEEDRRTERVTTISMKSNTHYSGIIEETYLPIMTYNVFKVFREHSGDSKVEDNVIRVVDTSNLYKLLQLDGDITNIIISDNNTTVIYYEHCDIDNNRRVNIIPDAMTSSMKIGLKMYLEMKKIH